ncbi:lactonase family protein [Wenyingzhuangia sp. IMCC45533]
MNQKYYTLFVLFITLNLVSQNNMKFYIGTYTNNDFSTSDGIYQSEIDSNGLLSEITLAAKTENPSYLTKTEDNKYLIATNTQTEGTITSFRISDDKLTKINHSAVEQNPCFITYKKPFVLTANYKSGSINLHKINQEGLLSKKLDTHKHFVSIPSLHKRQRAAFAHSCYFEPNSNNILSVDLGANKIMFWTINSEENKLILNSFSQLELPLESGPRLITFHPTLPVLYVINELSATISVIKKNTDSNTYSITDTIETLPSNFKEHNTAAHIEITKDGKFLYISNRGHDSIGVFKVNNDGMLCFVERVSVHGKHPRNFSLSSNNHFLVVANRDTNNICSFKRNPKSGKLVYVDEIKAPRATCILF